MGLKPHEEKKDVTIQVRCMKKGQVGVITSWGTVRSYIGRTLLMSGDGLVDVRDGETWSETPDGDTCRVRILPHGTLLEVE